MRHVFGTYLLAQLPGWVLAAIVLWALQDWNLLSTIYAAALFVVWVIKDFLLFPVMWRFYESEPPAQRMIGERGTVVTALAPSGLVRVRGELWTARSEHELPPGARVSVRDLDGLTLFVTPLDADRKDE